MPMGWLYAWCSIHKEGMSIKTLRRLFVSLAGRLTRKTRRRTLNLPLGWPWEKQLNSAQARLRTLPLYS